MCGILLIVVNENYKIFYLELSEYLLLKRRGPDIQNLDKLEYKNLQMIFYGSTLHLRGDYPVVQPLCLNGCKLLWNGEIFGGMEVYDFENDGTVLLNSLSVAATTEEILNIFSIIKGPWAFVFYQVGTNNMWFGRDIFGRRSLVYHFNLEKQNFMLSSTALKIADDWVELPAIGIYCMNLDNLKTTIYPWYLPNNEDNSSAKLNTFCDISSSLNLLQFEFDLSNNGLMCPFKFFVENIESCASNPYSPNQLIDPDVNVTLVNENIFITDGATHIPSNILMHATHKGLKLAKIFEQILSDAVRIRVTTRPKMCSDCISFHLKNKYESLKDSSNFSNEIKCDLKNNSSEIEINGSLGFQDHNCHHSKCCILFSGGIDSLVIAALAHRHISLEEPIDLLNVMFSKDLKSNDENSPSDRVTSIEAVQELEKIAPNRKWNLVQIDIEINELQRLRKEMIARLIYPLCSVLDDSIGCALWFAARGSGYIEDKNQSTVKYTSPARVILSGLGADEQLAGYSRHRLRFKENGVSGVGVELKMELRRISSRNLGRDDRIISDHGREVRFPFLDETLVQFLASLPVQSKADLTLERGIGEKLLLRIMAHRMGLVEGAVREKRAIQFGSGIAKLEKHKEKGSDICSRLN